MGEQEMTNGEKIQTILDVDKDCTKVHGENGTMTFEVTQEWWESECKESTPKNDLGVDAVSRQAVLDLVADYDLSMGQVVRGIHALSSVTPQEPRWIPVSERLPEEKITVFISCEDMYLQKLNPCVGWRNGQYWNTFTANGCKQILYPTAWMLLPKAYREVET